MVMVMRMMMTVVQGREEEAPFSRLRQGIFGLVLDGASSEIPPLVDPNSAGPPKRLPPRCSEGGEFGHVAPKKNCFAVVICGASTALLIALIVLLVLLFRGEPTPTTTMKTAGDKGECLVWGDPHVQTWDGAFTSPVTEGEYYLVKTETFSIQAWSFHRWVRSGSHQKWADCGPCPVGSATVGFERVRFLRLTTPMKAPAVRCNFGSSTRPRCALSLVNADSCPPRWRPQSCWVCCRRAPSRLPGGAHYAPADLVTSSSL